MRLEAEDVAEIRSMIEEEGGVCQWETITSTFIDEDKPWLGTTNGPTLTDVWICFVDMATAAAMLRQWGKADEIGSSTLYGLMGAYGFTPAIGERVLRGDEQEALIVKDITEAAPSEVVVFYLLEFSA